MKLIAKVSTETTFMQRKGKELELEDLTHEQKSINSLLKWGIVFSIVWLAGLGSLIAFRNGLKVKGKIKRNQELIGKGRAWWCIIVGGLGFLLWAPIVVIGVINNLT